tara:strand:- start:49111 stop:49524 length:414 start_codon:yes stop_codon:yes gene_type:complete
MNRGPEPRRGSNGDDRTMLEKARTAHGAAMPDWVAELAALVDQIGLKAAGARIGYSGSAISQVCNGKYRGSLATVETEVCAALLSPTVECPVLDTISREDCLAHQTKPFSAASHRSALLYHACRRCPHARTTKGNPS